jgi:hypothetical protein
MVVALDSRGTGSYSAPTESLNPLRTSVADPQSELGPFAFDVFKLLRRICGISLMLAEASWLCCYRRIAVPRKYRRQKHSPRDTVLI